MSKPDLSAISARPTLLQRLLVPGLELHTTSMARNRELVKALGGKPNLFDTLDFVGILAYQLRGKNDKAYRAAHTWYDPITRDGISEEGAWRALAQRGVVSEKQDEGIEQVRELLDGTTLHVRPFCDYEFRREVRDGVPGYIAERVVHDVM